MQFVRSVALALVVAGGALGAGSAGCGDSGLDGGGEGGGAAGGGPVNGPTYYKDVLPILQRSCLNCHSDGRIGGFSLGTYDVAKGQAGTMVAVTEAGLMPPWHAVETEDCQPRFGFVDDPRLSDDEKALLKAWSDAGAPEGDPADGPGDFEPGDAGLPNSDLDLTPSTPFVVDGDKDQFVCVVYDPQLTADTFVDGINIMPGNSKVAHHALVFRTSRAQAGDQERFDCFGSPPGDLVDAWAPGGTPLQMPATVGIPFSADDVLVVQMHYHPTGTSSEEDSSTLQLRFMTETPVWDFQISLPGNEFAAPGLLPDPDDRGAPEFRIPAGVKDHVESMVVEVPAAAVIDLPILMVATHMHYVGVDERFWIERANPGDQPAEECFLQTPAWDFNWQRGYFYDAAIADLPTATAGDKLHLECRYNNTMSNAFVVQALAQQGLSAPKDVVLGETTLDEMCLAAVGFLTPHL